MEFFLPDSHRVILELTLGEGEEEPDDGEAGWQKGTEGPEKPEGKVTKRSAQEQMKTRLDLFRAWRFTEEIKDSMVPLAERGGENEDGIGTWNARGPGEEWHFRCPEGTTESLSAFYSEPWSEGEKVNLSPFQGSGGSLL